MPELEKNAGTPAGNPNPAASPASQGAQPQGAANTPVTQTPAGSKPGVSPNPDENKDKQGTVPLAALQEEREKRQQLQAENDRLASLLTGGNHQQQSQPQQQQAQPDFRQEVEKLWETDPRKAVQAEIMMGLSWLDSVNATLEDQMDRIAAKDANFVQYRGQVRNYLRTLPLNQRGQPGIVDLALAVVKGQNVDDIVERTKNDLYEKFKSGQLAGIAGLSDAGVVSGAPVQKGTQLTEDQLKAAAAMRIDPAEYAKYIKQ